MEYFETLWKLQNLPNKIGYFINRLVFASPYQESFFQIIRSITINLAGSRLAHGTSGQYRTGRVYNLFKHLFWSKKKNKQKRKESFTMPTYN